MKTLARGRRSGIESSYLRTGGTGIFSREGQEFGGWGTSWFYASLLFFFSLPAHFFSLTYCLPSHQSKGTLEFF